jgi:hypothetical protein
MNCVARSRLLHLAEKEIFGLTAHSLLAVELDLAANTATTTRGRKFYLRTLLSVYLRSRGACGTIKLCDLLEVVNAHRTAVIACL